MALYRDLPNHYEDTSDPVKTVERVLEIAHVLFHLDQVCKRVCCPAHSADDICNTALQQFEKYRKWAGPFDILRCA